MKFYDVDFYLPKERVDVLAICKHMAGGHYYALLYRIDNRWFHSSGGIFTGNVIAYRNLKDPNSEKIKIVE